jgi:LysR family transcriptional regulator, low CO2-responsive transcriptional regulator
MDFDQLNTFLEVARQSSFSRAAERCFRSQPAISAQIRALEEEIGVRLFDRSGGKVSLTAAGKVFLAYAESAMEERRKIIATLGDMDRVPRGQIVVGANEGSCLHVLPEVFSDFKEQYPKVNVSINRMERGRILEAVIANAVDFGVVSMPIDDNRLKVVVIHRDELVLITAPDHLLAKTRPSSGATTLEDISQYPLLLPKVGRTRETIEEAFQKRRLKPQVSMELDSSELLKRFVAAGVGVGFIARSNVRSDVKAKVLAELRVADANIARDLALVYRKDKELSRAAQTFIEIAMRLKAEGAQKG